MPLKRPNGALKGGKVILAHWICMQDWLQIDLLKYPPVSAVYLSYLGFCLKAVLYENTGI